MKSIIKFLYCVLVIILITFCKLNSADFLDSGPDNTCKDDPERTSTGVSGFFRNVFIYLQPAHPFKDTKFYLYTKQNPTKRQELLLGNRQSINNSFFDPENPIRILIHGWQDTASNCFNVYVRNAYLKKGDFNVISVDWSVMSKTITYFRSIFWLNDVAIVINRFTRFLNKEFNVSFDNIYLIGHSLGAHLAGIAGRRLAPNKYNTIFGLDPAGVGFNILNRDRRLRSTDAYYVETIQPDITVYGYLGLLGNASIFLAYGLSTKNCKSSLPFLLSGCRHSSVYVYFAESITNSSSLMAYPCDTFANILEKNCVCSRRSDCNMLAKVGGDPSWKKNGEFLHVE